MVISTLLVEALTAGAIASAKGLATVAVKDAYAAVKSIIASRFKGLSESVDAVDGDPDSQENKDKLASEVAGADVASDPVLSAVLEDLVRALKDLKEDPKAGALLDFETLSVDGNMSLKDVDVEATAVKATTAKIKGDFSLEGVRQKN